MDGVRIKASSPQINNSTLSNNTRYGINISSATPRVVNSIVWGNTNNGISGSPVIAYCDIQGGYAGEGIIDVDPLFIDAPLVTIAWTSVHRPSMPAIR